MALLIKILDGFRIQMNNLLNLIGDIGIVFSRFGLGYLNGFRSNLTLLQVVNSYLFALM